MVKKVRPRVVWINERAYVSLQKAYDYIKEDSLINAEKVRDGILKVADSLSNHPQKYPVDKYKKNSPKTTGLLKNTSTGLSIK